MSKQTDFLYIMTDQHRADWLGCYGHPVVKTPNIDALADRGTKFTDFHVATPVCMPNRAAFMTGRYPTTNGLRYNGATLPMRANTFVDVLRASGYKTATIGKSHLQPISKEKPFAWDDPKERPIAEAWQPEKGNYTFEQPERFACDEHYEVPTPYYGFDHANIVTFHGANSAGHYLQWLRDKHQDWMELRDPAKQLRHEYTCPQALRTRLPEESYPTAYIRDSAVNYLRENFSSEAPLFTYVSFPDPHHPFTPPGKYWDMYKPDQFTLSARFGDHENPPPPLIAAHQIFANGKVPDVATSGFMVNDHQALEAMALTAGMITMIDDAVGSIVAVLEEIGRLENTVIIFNSDHGDYLGDFNMLLKGAWMHESITRVPMIWCDPADSTLRVRDDLTSTVDIAPTILKRAGISPYVGMQGHDLRPGETQVATARQSLLVEYNDGFARLGFDEPTRVRTVLTKDWRATIYRDQIWGELYDRRNDPLQIRNLWSDPEHSKVRGEMMELLAHRLMELMDESPRSNRAA
jgi:arylsulfatase A-like enzyme